MKPRKDASAEIDILRPIPTDSQAEAAVIGCLFLELRRLTDIQREGLEAEDFFEESNAALYRACVQMWGAGLKAVDFTVLRDMLVTQGKFEVVGGMQNILKIYNGSGLPIHAGFHAAIVVKRSRQRKIIAFGQQAVHQACTEGEPDLILADMELAIAATRSRSVVPSVSVLEAIDETLVKIEADVAAGRSAGLSTGLHCCDEAGVTFCGGELSILAAAPSVGKSALAMQACLYLGSKGISSLFVSAEMSREEMAFRLICAAAGVDAKKIRAYGATKDELVAMRRARVFFESIPVQIWTPQGGNCRASTIEGVIEYHKSRYGTRIAFVDYLQLLDPEPSGNPRETTTEKIGTTLKVFKKCGRRLNMPICLLCQLNREGNEARPQLKNLRGSGEIEQDADVVTFIWPLASTKGDPPGAVRRGIAVAKGRNSGTGEAVLHFYGPQVRFEDPDHPIVQQELFPY